MKVGHPGAALCQTVHSLGHRLVHREYFSWQSWLDLGTSQWQAMNCKSLPTRSSECGSGENWTRRPDNADVRNRDLDKTFVRAFSNYTLFNVQVRVFQLSQQEAV